jgi:hypothetical protein
MNIGSIHKACRIISVILSQKEFDTRYSRVLGISNIDFTPAHITAIGVLPSAVISEDISIAAQRKMKMICLIKILVLFLETLIKK